MTAPDHLITQKAWKCEAARVAQGRSAAELLENERGRDWLVTAFIYFWIAAALVTVGFVASAAYNKAESCVILPDQQKVCHKSGCIEFRVGDDGHYSYSPCPKPDYRYSFDLTK